MPRYSECRRIRRNVGDSCQQPYRADKPDQQAQHGDGNQFALGVEVHIPKLKQTAELQIIGDPFHGAIIGINTDQLTREVIQHFRVALSR